MIRFALIARCALRVGTSTPEHCFLERPTLQRAAALHTVQAQCSTEGTYLLPPPGTIISFF
jgi:hypothetical protein